MKPSPHILNELETTPLLASMERVCVFEVPAGYFDTVSKAIFSRINAPQSPLITEERNYLSVPPGYFENLSSQILNKIKQQEKQAASDELRQLSPLLYSIQNENPLTVPDGYFKNLPAGILDKINPQISKVVAMPKRMGMLRYAAAAVLTGMIAISSLMIFNRSSQEPIKERVTESGVVPSYVQQSYQYKNEDQVNEGISKLSDDEIVKYLQTTGNDADDAALQTNLEEKDLPAQKDYLLDEKTLDTYLNKLDAKRPE